jgi:hypothetical protein
MRKVYLLFCLFALTISSAFAQTGPKIQFESTTLEYGDIAKGSDGYRLFQFKNIGDAPLIITGTRGSCGCTIPEPPKEPIMPGAKGSVRVHYDTQRIGEFTKFVYVNTNEKDAKEITLTIHGKVLSDGEAVPAKKSNLLAPQG